MRFLLFLIVSVLIATASLAASSSSIEVSAAIQDLVPTVQAASLAKTYPVDKPIRWKLRAPSGTQTPGVFVFISAREFGDPPSEWIPLLDERNLLWISACDFGNLKPTAQRVLAALMGLAYAQREYPIDQHRVYVAGMSGGGRVASKVITKFPRLFNGAIFMGGADAWEESETSLVPEIVKNRYVFITGSNDFNRREIRTVLEQYQSAGVSQSYLIDLPHFGHRLPGANALRNALIYLDGT